MSQPETLLQLEILAVLRSLRVQAYRHVAGRRGKICMGLGVAAPDILGFMPPNGRVLALEVKMPGEKAAEAQLAWLASVERVGGVAAVVASVGDTLRVLQQCGYIRGAA